MTMQTREVGLADKLTAALELAKSAKSIVVKTAEDHATADAKCDMARQFVKDMIEEYGKLQCVIDAKKAQRIKVDTEEILKQFVKDVKGGPMLVYENEQERLRMVEQRRLEAIAKAEADAERDRQIAEQKKAYEAAEKERKAAEAARVKAEAAQKAAKGNALAAEAARRQAQAAEQARLDAEQRAEDARLEALRVKQDAAMAKPAVVVVEKSTPTVPRRQVPKFEIEDASKLPRQYLVPNEVAIGGVIRSLRANHGIPGVRYYEVSA